MRNIFGISLIVFLGLTNQVFGQKNNNTTNCCVFYDSILSRSYYTAADKMPTFKGGSKKLVKTIDKNLKWPGGRCDVEGVVWVACIIEANGQLTNKKIIKGISSSKNCNADSEALKVIDFLTSWKPGQCDGKNIAAHYVIPVRFKMTVD
jgi:TonB family protein